MILCTSEKTLKAHLLGNLCGTAFLTIFGAIYEYFSFGVYSYWMTYAFVIPLMLGVIPYTLLMMKGSTRLRAFLRLWGAAIAVLSAGSVLQGVLEIYGTTNRLMIVYPISGGLLLLSGLISFLYESRKLRGHVSSSE